MGQCTSKPSREKNCDSSDENFTNQLSESECRRPEECELSDDEMSVKKSSRNESLVKNRQSPTKKSDSKKRDEPQAKGKRKSSDNGESKPRQVSEGKLSAYQNVAKRKESFEEKLTLPKKNSLNNSVRKNSGKNSYEYCDSNTSFLVHDVIKKGGCETFVIDFNDADNNRQIAAKKRPPLKRKNPPTSPPISKVFDNSLYYYNIIYTKFMKQTHTKDFCSINVKI